MRYPNRVVSILAVFAVVSFKGTCYGYLPLYQHPSMVAQQAELIVEGRLKQGSVEYLSEKRELWSKDARWYAPRAKLIVKQVLRGKFVEKEILVWFRGTAVPVVGGHFEWDFGAARHRLVIRRKGLDPEAIQIFEVNNSTYDMSWGRDLRADHVWFLKSFTELPGTRAKEQGWGLDSPQYIIPVADKDYYLAYLAKDVKAALLAQQKQRPDLTEEITTYIAYLDALECNKIADAAERSRKLLPIFLHAPERHPYPASTAKKGLLLSGKVAGELLAKALGGLENRESRSRAIELLGGLRFREAVPVLAKILDAHNARWKTKPAPDPEQPLAEPGVLDDAAEPESRRARKGADSSDAFRDDIDEMYCLIKALGQIGDPGAAGVLRETKSQWHGYEGIIAACDEAIEAIRGPTKEPPARR